MAPGDTTPSDEPPPWKRVWNRIRRSRQSDSYAVTLTWDLIEIVGLVLIIGAVLYGATGVWPPFAAVESGSMQPNLETGDLVIVMDTEKGVPDAAHGDTGIVTTRAGGPADYTKFGHAGDVVIYQANGDPGDVVIHRARFWVDAGENWYDEANVSHLENASNCRELAHCPAPHAGFITKGDANQRYDQVMGISGPVKPEWVIGTAEFNVPYLGYFRLAVTWL